jgi:Domain of unknown function (DUF4190)
MTVPGGDPGEKPKDEAQQPSPSGQGARQPEPNGPAESPPGPTPPLHPPASGYPPPAHPPPGYPPSASYGPPGYQDAAGHGPSYPPPPPEYGQPYPGEYPPPGYPGGDAHQPETNTLAIASLVVSLIGLLFPILSIVGIVLGAVAVNQIKHTRQRGYGMAVSGIVVGIATVVIYVVFVATFRMH